MRYKGVRRLPIVGADGQLIGIVAIDDLLAVLAEELDDVAKIIARGQMHEVVARK
jgi:CBS domain-containing protein